jgi:hypothetical protein
MKKTFVILLALLLILGLASSALAANDVSFSDVPTNHWAYGAVAKLANAGLIDGYSDGTFRGDKPITRYEFAILITRTMGQYEKADVPLINN